MSYKDYIISEGPVAFWPLDETTGTTAVDVINSINGTYTGGYTQGAATLTHLPGAVQFDGSSGYVDIPADARLALSTWSVEAWVYFDSFNIGSGVVSEKYTGGAEPLNYELGIDPKNRSNTDLTLVSYNDPWSNPANAGVQPLSQWLHIVGVFDGRLIIYVDGAQKDSVSPGISMPVDNDGVVIARRHDLNAGASPYTHGRISAVAIYDYALSPQQVNTHNKTGLNGTVIFSGADKSLQGTPIRAIGWNTGELITEVNSNPVDGSYSIDVPHADTQIALVSFPGGGFKPKAHGPFTL